MARIKPQTLLLQSKKKKGPTRISVTTIILCNLFIVLIVLSLVATYRHWSQRSRKQEEEDGLLNHEVVDSYVDPKKFDLPSFAILNTSKGSITVELYKDASPEVVDNFLDMCQKGHFKGMLFHRVIKNYVIQAGDFQRLGAAEDWTSKIKPHGQSPKHEAFMLGTPKTKSDHKGFELFITTAPIPDLNEKLTIFGRVVKGEDIVQMPIEHGDNFFQLFKNAVNAHYQASVFQEIEEVDTDEHYRPKSPIGIINVTLKRQL
ncbi:hypothetical protein Scep_029036 [Stephania cephalantha]|uniref:Peptidyl-prolyl cis-trans isomerase n=1 Tax=Stephania cephalantha TaxID=152367 RepID=A0AAP0HK68_9MAGN